MIDFPNSPTTGQIYNSGTGPIYIWDGVAWNLVATTPPPQAWELIADTFIPAGTVNWPILNLAPFKRLRLKSNLSPSVATQICWRVSADNGATWISTSSYQMTGFFATQSAVSVSYAVGAAALPSHGNSDVNITAYMSSEIEDFNNTLVTKGMMHANTISGGLLNTTTRSIGIAGNVAYNALLLLGSAGTISGNFLLEGVRG